MKFMNRKNLEKLPEFDEYKKLDENKKFWKKNQRIVFSLSLKLG